MSFGDHTGASIVYSASNTFSWAQQLLIPGIQAAANILLLERQRGLYDEIATEQRALIDVSLTNYLSRLDQILPLFEAAYDEVPAAAEYVPVDPCQEQGCTIECNISHIVRADVWASCVNRHTEQNDITRAIALDPRYLANIDIFSLSVQDLLRGKLHTSDVMEVMTDTAEQGALAGRIGGVTNLTNRNLGISRIRAQAAGRKAMREQMAMLNQDVSPIARQVHINDMMVTPQQRIGLALTQAQLIQNSLQNVFNQAARKPPHLLAELSLQLDGIINRLKGEASKASMVNGFVPDYATALQPQMHDVANKFNTTITKTVGAAPPRAPQTSYSTPSEGGGLPSYSGAKSGI